MKSEPSGPTNRNLLRLTLAKMPQKIAGLFTVLHGSAWLFMLATVVTLVVTGALLEGLPALLIFGPLFLPMAPGLGIDPLQYGMTAVERNALRLRLADTGLTCPVRQSWLPLRCSRPMRHGE